MKHQHKMQTAIRHRSSTAGFTMIESLVTLVILSVGLLGLAGMQTIGLNMNHDAQLRSVATNITYNAIEVMRLNRAAALNGDFAGTYTVPTDTDASCATGSSDLDDIKLCWRVALRDHFGAATFTITGPSGSANNKFNLVITWSDTWIAEGQEAASTSSQSLDFKI